MKGNNRIRKRCRYATILAFSLPLLGAAKIGDAPKVLDWGALGSGCRSRPAEQSDVTLLEPILVKNGVVYQFLLSKYAIDGEKPVTPSEPAFARDCSIRLVVQPPPGTRIQSIASESRFRINKSEGFSFQIAGAINTPRAQIGLTSFLYDAQQRLTDTDVVVRVVPERGGVAGNMESQCDEARVLGVDLALSNDRKSFKQKIGAILAGDQRVKLEILFEKCATAAGR